MCMVTEHVKLKKRVQELELQVVELTPPELPRHTYHSDIKWSELVHNLEELGIVLMTKPEYVPDALVTYTGLLYSKQIAPFLVTPADAYAEGVADCDDYAMMAAAKASIDFKLNSFRVCWGDSQWGYHAYVLVIVGPKEFWLMEPNAGAPWAGELFKFGEYGYVPKSWS